MKKNKVLSNNTNHNLSKLELLITHLKKSSLPTGDELERYTLLISQTLSSAYTEKVDLFKKKKQYQKTLNYVNTLIKFLRDHFESNVISPFHMHIIYKDLQSLTDGLSDIISLLDHSPLFPNDH